MSSLNDIRSTFLKYFANNGHKVVDSSPVVPRNDPTLMFTAAGMVQFKNVFTGIEQRDYSRAVTSQKCVRAGGKHNDLDNVGYTARHHTFFEMLGNFSFGDYFKQDAIPFAWDLITKEFEIDRNRLLVTVYHTDEEAVEIWKKYAGLSDDRIIRIATDDNFWSMGSTGPCGPCTEIFYDHGDHILGGPPGSAEEDGDRFIEIWNLVFMQYERFEDGREELLPRPSIDTGMGLERIGALLQGSHDNYETDVFKALIEASAQATGVEPFGDQNVHHRVIADHLRSTSFMMADGVMPSNEGRGYVLRRIMRRAMRHAHLLGAKDPVMHRLVPEVVTQMGQAFPELVQAQALIVDSLLNEETRFRQTLDRGLKQLDDAMLDIADDEDFPGETAFKLYDTYGFPLDLTQDALREKGRVVDVVGFDRAMALQKTKARAAWSGSGATMDVGIWFEIADTEGVSEFLGHNTDSAEGQIVALVKNDQRVETVVPGDCVQIVFNQTPFYAESGGQVGDSGTLKTDTCRGWITDTKKSGDVFIHLVEVAEGTLSVGAGTSLVIDKARRSAICANHSATHLLHEALRGALGDHVAQRGSLNNEDRLRFDFSHSKPLDATELAGVEAEVNKYIRQNSAVETRIMTPDKARALGAQALFGEKYGEEVRVVSMGRQGGSGKGTDKTAYSLELCGGTHVQKTGDIGVFVLLGDSAISAGVRRIEALTGEAAFQHLTRQRQQLAAVAEALKSSPSEVSERVQTLLDERKALSNELAQLRRELAMRDVGSGADVTSKEINGVTFVAQIVSGVSGKDLPALIDEHKGRIGSGVVLLMADDGAKVSVAVGVTEDLTSMVSAVDMVRAVVIVLGGKGGGGRADMAQGGGKDISCSTAAVAAAENYLADEIVMHLS